MTSTDKEPYPIDRDWDAMPEVGLEVWPTYSADVAAWAEDQAKALRSRDFEQLDTDNLADAILDVARTERFELSYRLSALMASLARQLLQNDVPSRADQRLIKEQRKLVLAQLERCPSLEKALSDPNYLSECWSDAVVTLGVAGLHVEVLPDSCPWGAGKLLNLDTPN